MLNATLTYAASQLVSSRGKGATGRELCQQRLCRKQHVVCSPAFLLYQPDPVAVLREMKRVLAPGELVAIRNDDKLIEKII